jgi:steroid 5-alpha reductase family enzyme
VKFWQKHEIQYKFSLKKWFSIARSEGTKIVKTIRFLYLIFSVEQAPILHYCNIWNFLVTNYMIFWEKICQNLKYISLTLTITKFFLETLKKIKYFYFQRKTSVKAKMKERGVFTVDSLLFQLDSFRQKEKFKSKFEKWSDSRGFSICQKWGEKRVKNSQISIFGFQCVAKKLINHVYFISGL